MTYGLYLIENTLSNLHYRSLECQHGGSERGRFYTVYPRLYHQDLVRPAKMYRGDIFSSRWCVWSRRFSWPGCNCVSKVSFSNFIAWTAFVNALIDMIIHLAGLWERLIWWFRHPALYLILCGVAVVGFLIGASLAASCATQTCVSNPGTAGAAAFFGFACLALFAAECCIHFQKYRSMQQEAQHQSSSGGKAPDFEEPPPPYSEAPGVI